jgi:hypothetical protein
VNSLEVLTEAMDGQIEGQVPACSYVIERFDLVSEKWWWLSNAQQAHCMATLNSTTVVTYFTCQAGRQEILSYRNSRKAWVDSQGLSAP